MKREIIWLVVLLMMASCAYAITCSTDSTKLVVVGTSEDISISCSGIGSTTTVTVTPSGYSASCLQLDKGSDALSSSSASATFTVTGLSRACQNNVGSRTIGWTFTASDSSSISGEETVVSVVSPPSMVVSFVEADYSGIEGGNVTLVLEIATPPQNQIDIQDVVATVSTALNLSSDDGLYNQTISMIDVSESSTVYLTWMLTNLPPPPPGAEGYNFSVSITAANANSDSTDTVIILSNESGSTEITIQLKDGWNLISIPVTASNTTTAAVMSSVSDDWSGIYSWDASGTQYLFNDKSLPGFISLTDITPSIGFWVNMDADANLSVTGTVPDSGVTDFDIAIGWNMVGYPSADSQNLSSALSTIAGKYTGVYAWDSTNST
ncbi:hypothetical protein HQ545_07690 [Candidatus Woesearchaeota archaeon]|nr:hypothetical protein [Candidatus Woesearchaeota archaeon]